MWQLPPGLLSSVLIVELTTISLVVVSLLTQPGIDRGHLIELVALAVLGIAHSEASRDIERKRWRLGGDVYVDMTSVWIFAAAASGVPIGYAGLLAAVVYSYMWARQARARAPLYRLLFSTATIVLSCMAATMIIHVVTAALPAPAAPVADALGILVYITINSALVAGAIAVSSGGGTSPSDLLGEWDENLIELAALSLGALVAAALTLNPFLVGFALPPLIVLQRAALVRHLELAATLDAKTGLLNAGAWHTRAEQELLRARRQDTVPCGVLVLDLDHFKNVNDRHGHLAGDRVLVAVAGELQHEVRARDLVGRFGGEEFVVLMSGQGREVAAQADQYAYALAERLRQRIAELRVEVPTADGPLTISDLTISVGGAVAADGVDVTGLLALADTELYEAKRAGRNRVRISSTATTASGTTTAPTAALELATPTLSWPEQPSS